MKDLKNAITKVAIGIPSGEMVHADFAMALTNLTAFSILQGVHVVLINIKASIIEYGRCEIVENAKSVGAKYLLYLDSDMLFPPDALIRLMKRNKDIICCDARQKREPFNTVVKTIDEKRIDHEDPKTPELVELIGVSPAVMLVDMKVFDKIQKPYFHVEWLTENKFLGEDYYFSQKAVKAGIKVWCDTKLSQQIGHLGVNAYYVPRVKKESSLIEFPR